MKLVDKMTMNMVLPKNILRKRKMGDNLATIKQDHMGEC
jgi:hypothetical protein